MTNIRPYLPYAVILIIFVALIPVFFAISRATEGPDTITQLQKLCATSATVPPWCAQP